MPADTSDNGTMRANRRTAWGENERNVQLPEAALIIASDEHHAARSRDNPDLVDSVGCLPCDCGYLASPADPRRVEHSPTAEIGEIDGLPFLDLGCCVYAGPAIQNFRNLMGLDLARAL